MTEPTAPNLQQTQLAFARAIRHPQEPYAEQTVPTARLQIYQQLFFNNVSGFIDNAFPVLSTLYQPDAWLSLKQRFFADYRCHSPYFLHIAQQFVDFLQQYQPAAADPPFLAELAHYEWAELYVGTLAVTSAQQAVIPAQLMSARLRLTEASLLAVYQYPVQHLSPDYQVNEPGPGQAFLIYRDWQDEVIFVQLNQASLLLLHLLTEQPGQTLPQLTASLAPQLAPYSAAQLTEFALPLLTELAVKGALLHDGG
ncbi:DUF2063 domain-containing protein [Alishewanella sp. HH-ZS]|uniref:HvfC family RiPP maturation protein n=1 Tax=Alishewanella sp. HH-ZS TaxID=1856684 RepID=UPI0008236464|nr:putative DNA-binding domain-containing protein [Alishewanella sp. HH-ZS]OCW96589.1 DUF2063 domain-containing protein [Alishewanella sp. HH-ZS]